MNDTSPVLEWRDVARLMEKMADELPPDWDSSTSSFALLAMQQLAELVVRLRFILPVEEVAPLVSAGGLLVAMAQRHVEAADIATALLARITGEKGGGHV